MEIPFFAIVCMAYFIGAIPWGAILTRVFKSMDIRQVGSGNIGATNVMRTAGMPLGILTLAGDVLKGIVSTGMVLAFTESSGLRLDIYLSAAILCAFLGHLYSVFLKFKGGKGVATAAGCFLVAAPTAFLLVLPVFIGVFLVCRRVSAASLTAAFVLPVFVWLSGTSIVLTGCAVLIMIFIFLRHRENIRRLAGGTEPALRIGT